MVCASDCTIVRTELTPCVPRCFSVAPSCWQLDFMGVVHSQGKFMQKRSPDSASLLSSR